MYEKDVKYVIAIRKLLLVIRTINNTQLRPSSKSPHALAVPRETARYPNRMDAHERNERTLARALGELIPQLKDPRIPLVVTVERVKLNSDYSQAKVLVSTLNEDDMPDFQDALERASGFLQRELANDLDLRRTPRLVFTDNPLEVL